MSNTDHHKPQQSDAALPPESFSSTVNFNDPNQQWPAKVAMSGSACPRPENMEDEDLIEDDYDSYDELFTQHFTDENLSQLDGTKSVRPSRGSPEPASARTAKGQHKSTSNTKRFLLPSRTSSKNEFPEYSTLAQEDLPWAQRYAPLTLDELAVHKRKVRDVEQWLDNALTGKARRKLLVLKGPAGSGKTTTVSLLADKLKFNILEWKTPSTFKYATRDYISLGAQFDEFLGRGCNYGRLDLDSTDVFQSSLDENPQRRIILIEEFPTISGRNFSALAAFRLSLLRYISGNVSHSGTDHDTQAIIPPIVIILSETLSNSESTSDNLTVHRLLGRQLCSHPTVTHIEFNSIAPTFMFKALDLVLQKSARHPAGGQGLTQSILEDISKVGDIRNAITSLEFICLGSDHQHSRTNQLVKISRSTRTRRNLSAVNVKTPAVITQREANLGLFHAIGKIVYNKRDDNTCKGESKLPSPPEHLRHFNRPRVSQVHINELLGEIETDIHLFIKALHENYVPSCNGPAFTEYLDGCIGALSDSDLMCTDRKGDTRYQAGLGIGFIRSGAGVDLLRQEEISFQVAVRGLLFALPCPVTRQSLYPGITSRTSDLHKLSFPPTTRLLRDMEENWRLIDMCSDALLNASMRPTAVPPSNIKCSVECTSTRALEDYENGSAATTAIISRSDLILHQLPYMARISNEMQSFNIQRVTGFGGQNLNHSFQQGEESSEQPHSKDPKFNFKRGNNNTLNSLLLPQADDEQLVLSEDEIVDDE
ncbi:Rad17 cell cycle checkpoint protein-domain-containing protein [Aspergillus karnatakaensis]|uniref:putative cell cycle checkpoint protein Rad17 n=1 Tax=Aspergillus karnatakaensis TaxID=1810916 RepID=UPI003CCE1BF8